MHVTDPSQIEVVIDYTNWKGERRERRIRPLGSLDYNSTQYHTEPQWLIQAVDVEDEDEDGNKLNTIKWFALKDVHSWRPVNG